MSEEFLRKMEAGGEAQSTVAGEGGGPGEELFPEDTYGGGKRKSERRPSKK